MSNDPDLSDPRFYLNRELSELQFQHRVLHEALDERTPLLERAKFLAFFTKNVDEFFMKRVGGLKQQIDAGVTERTPDGRTPEEQWHEVHETVRPMFEEQTDCYLNDLRPALADAGVHIEDYDDLPTDRQDDLREYLETSVLPTLTPLTFDPAHPFPFISNLSLSLGVLSTGKNPEKQTFTRIKIPPNRPRLVPVDDATFVLMEDVIASNLDIVLPGVEVIDVALFRLTRNAEVRRNEEIAEDLVEMIEEVLEQRRFASAVRLEISEDAPQRIVDILVDQLNLSDQEVYHREGPIDYRAFFDLLDLDRPDLKDEPWTPQPHPRFDAERGAMNDEEDRDVFDEIRDGDVLVHHPYHSFDDTVQRFLEAAANDPDVLAIKAAIYRTASDSKVIQTLIDAAENGKQVAVMVELKARFDEENNLEWVRRLEEHGIHVAYGTVGYKTHTKTALVVREEGDEVRLYSHVGTGNYHSETAKTYVDLGVLTADRDIGQDLTRLFNFFTGPALDDRFRKLLIAPVTMREKFTSFVRREADHARAGRDARIVVKLNGLEDPEMVEELYRASMAGVDIDLLVRDICRLRPGLEGISDTVDVHSVVGRFLEHSRIYYFENAGDPEYYVGSADWMTRNLDNRVEAVAPVTDPAIRAELRFVIETMLADNRRRWTMGAEGDYEQCRPGPDEAVRDTQQILMDRTREGIAPSLAHSAPTNEGHDLLVVPTEHEDPDADTVEDDTADDAGPVELSGDGGVTQSIDDASEHPQSAEADASVAGTRAADPTDGPTPDGSSADDRPEAFDRHPDRWYVPESDAYRWAVRTADGDRRYYKTADGAAERLRREYDEA